MAPSGQVSRRANKPANPSQKAKSAEQPGNSLQHALQACIANAKVDSARTAVASCLANTQATSEALKTSSIFFVENHVAPPWQAFNWHVHTMRRKITGDADAERALEVLALWRWRRRIRLENELLERVEQHRHRAPFRYHRRFSAKRQLITNTLGRWRHRRLNDGWRKWARVSRGLANATNAIPLSEHLTTLAQAVRTCAARRRRVSFRRWAALGEFHRWMRSARETSDRLSRAKSFQRWHTTLSQERAAARVAKKVLSTWLHQSTSQAMALWVELATARRTAHRKMRRLVTRWREKDLLGALEQWQSRSLGRASCTRRLQGVLETWRLRELREGWDALREATRAAKGADDLHRRARNVMRRWMRADLLWAWALWCKRRSTTLRAAARLHTAVVRWHKHERNGAWRRWRAMIATVDQMFTAAHSWRSRHTISAMQHWRKVAGEQARAMGAARKVVTMWLNRQASSAWERWRDHARARAAALQTLARSAQRLLSHELLFHYLRWRDVCVRCADQRALLRRVLTAWQRRELRLALDAFVGSSTRAAAHATCVAAAARVVGRWRLGELVWSWERWSVAQRQLVATGTVMRAAVDMWMNAKRNRAWRRLVGRAASARVVRQVLCTWQLKELEAAFAQWQRRADEQGTALAAGHKVLGMWLHRVKSDAWRQWASIVLMELEALATIDRVITLWHLAQLRSAWHTLRLTTAASQALESTVSAARRVVQRWRRVELAAGWTSWVERHARMDLVSEQLQIAATKWHHRECLGVWRKLKAVAQNFQTLRTVLAWWQSRERRVALTQWWTIVHEQRRAIEVGIRVVQRWQLMMLRVGFGRFVDACATQVEVEETLHARAVTILERHFVLPRAHAWWRAEADRRRRAILALRPLVEARLTRLAAAWEEWRPLGIERARRRATARRQAFAERAHKSRLMNTRWEAEAAAAAAAAVVSSQAPLPGGAARGLRSPASEARQPATASTPAVQPPPHLGDMLEVPSFYVAEQRVALPHQIAHEVVHLSPRRGMTSPTPEAPHSLTPERPEAATPRQPATPTTTTRRLAFDTPGSPHRASSRSWRDDVYNHLAATPSGRGTLFERGIFDRGSPSVLPTPRPPATPQAPSTPHRPPPLLVVRAGEVAPPLPRAVPLGSAGKPRSHGRRPWHDTPAKARERAAAAMPIHQPWQDTPTALERGDARGLRSDSGRGAGTPTPNRPLRGASAAIERGETRGRAVAATPTSTARPRPKGSALSSSAISPRRPRPTSTSSWYATAVCASLDL